MPFDKLKHLRRSARGLKTGFARLPAPTQAALLALGASFAFAGLNAAARALSDHLHSFVITFWRNFFGLFFMLPWLWRYGLGSLRTGRLGLFITRSSLSLAGMLCNFSALALVPFANATALSFMAPLFATVLAAFALHEHVRLRRWSATLAGFAGAIIILNPGGAGISWGETLAIAGAFLAALNAIVVKNLSRSESAQAIVTYMVLLLTPMSFVVALPFWSWPRLIDWPLVIVMGLFGTFGHLCWTRAVALADASLVMPYDYARMIFAALIGYAIFGETLDRHTILGGLVIAAAGIYTVRREAQLHKHTAALATTAAATAANPPNAENATRQ